MRSGSHFEAWGPVSRLLRAVTRRTWRTGPKSVGAHHGSLGRPTNSSRRIRGLRDGPRVLVPELRRYEVRWSRGERRGRDMVVVLSSTSGPSSFLLNGWPNTSYVRTHDVSCKTISCATGFVQASRPHPLRHFFFAASGKWQVEKLFFIWTRWFTRRSVNYARFVSKRVAIRHKIVKANSSFIWSRVFLGGIFSSCRFWSLF